MTKAWHHVTILGGLVLVASALVLGTGQGPESAIAQSVERASILPCARCQVGPADRTAAGYTIQANGVTDYWLTAKQGTIDFVVFVDPGHNVTQDITFALWPPGGADQPLTEYTFKHVDIPVEGLWFQIPAQGDFSVPGTYTAAVYANGQSIGDIPVVLANPPSGIANRRGLSGRVLPMPPLLGTVHTKQTPTR